MVLAVVLEVGCDCEYIEISGLVEKKTVTSPCGPRSNWICQKWRVVSKDIDFKLSTLRFRIWGFRFWLWSLGFRVCVLRFMV